MCPKGKGFVPVGEYSYDVGGENYKGENPVLMNFQDMCPIRHSSKSMACVRQNQNSYTMETDSKTFNSTFGQKLLWTLDRAVHGLGVRILQAV